ncbi:YhcN/YlaJ family sporulation lipoprotein [Tissierella sp. MB52-C2]|uniref:YhcN/YlaJ family sporulation lipoprotein n=1 Tax=Tissierella sp. MB52-C2 TaxID=3070999 RepID=UPI00280BA17B|nr:YhcN/YlaJ family sporulation lipoprotein [Tissierella sp. MB52-C2]WMM26949.1 YhcN/YlaJ family sporulation lipoprotein [Tissierella sp. MB52-C2]
MKNNKFKLLGLSLVIAIAVAGCTTKGTNYRNMSTQARLNGNVNNRWMDNTGLNTRDRLNTSVNDGMVRNNNLSNGMVRNDNLSNGMVRNNAGLYNNGSANTPMNYNSLRNQTTVTDTNVTHMSGRAAEIAKRVAELPEVKDASVVIHGDTALVGCDLRNNAANTNATNTISNSLKQRIEAAVKVADKNIKNVSVTSEPTVYNRIRTISTDVYNNGHPIAGFTNEIRGIINRITAPVR